MKTLYFDAFSGASGDMILGALLDLGLELRALRTALATLAKGRFELRRRRVISGSLAATKIDVRIGAKDEPERNFREIASVIDGSRLAPRVKERALEIFRRLCEAEAAAHGVRFERVHLHEAGALDAIADICGAAWLLDALAPERILASPLNVGSGTIECRHGTFPVPGPATARLVKGVPVYAAGPPVELLTPTGAAILTSVVSEYRPLPPMAIEAVGYGAGDRVLPGRPNVLRAVLGESSADVRPDGGDVIVIETTIDDMNPQIYGFLLDRALAAGALEVYFTPVFMKKGRPGTQVTVIVEPERFDKVARLIFRESTTIGFRYRREARRELARRTTTVATPYGPIRVKVSSDGPEAVHAQPEYEDCRRAAEGRKVPLKEVQRAALAAWASKQRVETVTPRGRKRR